VQGEKELKQSWQALLFGMAIMATLGIVLFFKEGGSLFGYAFRAGSLHEGYGGMATYLALVWPFVLLAPRTIRLKRYQWTLYGLIPFTLFISYLTYSRIGWMTMLVEAGLILFLLSKKRLKTGGAAVVLFILAIVVVFNLPGSRHGETWTKLFENPQQVGGTAGDLFALWNHSYREIKKSPFTGIGLGRSSFDKAYPDFRATHQPLLFHAHNMFVDITLQMGIQGLVAILCIIGVLWAVLWPWAPPRADDLFANYKTAAVVSLIGFCLRNMTDDFFVKDSALLFWLIMGLALGAKMVLGKDKSGVAPRKTGGKLKGN
jgi:O-antigen ligase